MLIGCDFVDGDGTGGGEKFIGTVSNPKECVDKCVQSRVTYPTINGVTVDSGTGRNCYCEFDMKGSNGAKSWKTCKLLGSKCVTDVIMFMCECTLMWLLASGNPRDMYFSVD